MPKGISKIQKKELFKFLENHNELITGKFDRKFTIKNGQTLWIEIAKTLNKLDGDKKHWKLWRKTWQDMRSRTKSKSWADGAENFETLSKTEEHVLRIADPELYLLYKQSHVIDDDDGGTDDEEDLFLVPKKKTKKPAKSKNKRKDYNKKKLNETVNIFDTDVQNNLIDSSSLKEELVKSENIKYETDVVSNLIGHSNIEIETSESLIVLSNLRIPEIPKNSVATFMANTDGQLSLIGTPEEVPKYKILPKKRKEYDDDLLEFLSPERITKQIYEAVSDYSVENPFEINKNTDAQILERKPQQYENELHEFLLPKKVPKQIIEEAVSNCTDEIPTEFKNTKKYKIFKTRKPNKFENNDLLEFLSPNKISKLTIYKADSDYREEIPMEIREFKKNTDVQLGLIDSRKEVLNTFLPRKRKKIDDNKLHEFNLSPKKIPKHTIYEKTSDYTVSLSFVEPEVPKYNIPTRTPKLYNNELHEFLVPKEIAKDIIYEADHTKEIPIPDKRQKFTILYDEILIPAKIEKPVIDSANLSSTDIKPKFIVHNVIVPNPLRFPKKPDEVCFDKPKYNDDIIINEPKLDPIEVTNMNRQIINEKESIGNNVISSDLIKFNPIASKNTDTNTQITNEKKMIVNAAINSNVIKSDPTASRNANTKKQIINKQKIIIDSKLVKANFIASTNANTNKKIVNKAINSNVNKSSLIVNTNTQSINEKIVNNAISSKVIESTNTITQNSNKEEIIANDEINSNVIEPSYKSNLNESNIIKNDIANEKINSVDLSNDRSAVLLTEVSLIPRKLIKPEKICKFSYKDKVVKTEEKRNDFFEDYYNSKLKLIERSVIAQEERNILQRKKISNQMQILSVLEQISNNLLKKKT